MIATLNEAKQEHYYDSSNGGSCQAAEFVGGKCDCSADEFNARIEQIIEYLEAQ